MKENHFVFADLSTYDTNVAQHFYSNIFGWDYQGDKPYQLATYQGKEISGLYETPPKFKEMNMPSFWMSYIQVENIDHTVEKAKKLGGIIELVDKKQTIGKITLIRDPLGAGFTIYEGDQLHSRYDNAPNALVWNELFISDYSKIKPFYEGIFNWSLEASTDSGRYYIKNTQGKKIGAIQEVSNNIKGDKEYWSVYFGVEDIEKTQAKVLAHKGSLIYENANTTVLADPFGAFFHIVPIQQNSSKGYKSFDSVATNKIPWKALLGLFLIGLSLLTGWYGIWGVFFALWVLSDLRSGFTHLFEPISRKKNPLLYWVIVGVWAFLGVYSAAYYTQPQWFYVDQVSSASENEKPSFQAIQHIISNFSPSEVKEEESPSSLSHTLDYQLIEESPQHFVGIETLLSGNAEEDQQYVNELWQYFSQNDISSVIDPISDERVYLLYIDFDEALNSYTKALLGYRVSKVEQLYEGLASHSLPASQFASLKSRDNKEEFLLNTWEQVSQSDLIKKSKDAIEIYSFSDENEVREIELRVEL